MSELLGDRDATDALRSMKRYVALALGGAWEVRLTDEDNTFERPYALVARVGPTTYTGRALIRDAVQAFVVTAYPLLSTTGLMDESLLAGMAAEELLYEGFERGIDQGAPRRVPFYDYGNLALRDPSDVRQANEFMRVSDFSSETVQDPDDLKLTVVHADVRVAWRRRGALSSADRTVQRFTAKEQPLV